MKNLARLPRAVGVLTLFALVSVMRAPAQQISGSISGVVEDAQHAVVAGAKVTLASLAQGITRVQATSSDGTFVFTPLPPASYTLTVEMAGFKRFEQKDIKIFASDRIAVPNIVLELGQVVDTITVEATVVQLQTQTAERAGVITARQVNDLALKARDFIDLAATVPGVYYRGGLGGICANGARCNQNNLQVDGVTNVDTGSNGGVLATMNVDQIGEFKLITNSQPAEIGRSSGATIQVVTKAGTREFHGGGYWFHRHEGLNANDWRSNQDKLARKLFRYNYEGYNVGGPILLPFTNFNKGRDRLFFFWSQEFQNSLQPNTLRSVTVPTAAERAGDFSQTHDGSGRPVIIRDPSTGSPFPSNMIPRDRWSADGAKILSFYPLPNRLGVANDYNFQSQVSDSQPRREQMLRGDYNITDKWRLYSRYMFTKSEVNKAYGQWNADYNIPYAPMNFGNPGWSFITNVTTVINPTLTNEFIFGSSRNQLNIDPVDNTFDRGKLNLSYTMPFPKADPLNLVQNWRFENVPNGPFTGFNGTPFRNFNHTWDITDNVSKVHGVHASKAGIYLHRSWKDQTAFTSANGNIYFNRDSANPGDTNWDFSNALLGNFQRAQQSNVVLNAQYRNWNIEWFLQDNWKITPKLTLDLGLRFYWIEPQYDQAKQTSSFNPALYDPSATAVLMQRQINPATGQAAAFNPLTGTYGPAALIGTIIPTGKGFVNGLYANGMGLAGQNGYPIGLLNDRGVHYAPRIGVAWQVMPKTVVRAGGGAFYDRFQGNPVFEMLPNPPSTISPTFYYANLATLGSSSGVFAPPNVRAFSIDGHVPTTYNWNISVQRELPAQVLLDIAYVGSHSLHELDRYNVNAAPFGSAWLPQNQDPTIASPTFDGRTAKPINLYRPYLGYGDISVTEFGGMSNYNSLQIAANRRLTKTLNFGVAYTWSKVLGTTGDDGDNLHLTNFRAANYGPLNFDIPHMFVFNYTWNLPKIAEHLGFVNNPVGRLIFNNWEISGVTTFSKGEPEFINIGDVPGPDGSAVNGSNRNRIYTGSENVAPRPYYSGNTMNGSSVYAWIDPSAVKAPIIRQSAGLESGQRPIRKPGINNWDISVFKNIPFGAEQRYLQLRWEMFNAWNHPQFNDFNRTVNFDRSGNITNLPGPSNRYGFGALTGVRDPRIIQIAAKFYF
jgi:hypothetical protein